MPAWAVAFALLSAVSSGVWNTLLKGAADNEAASAVALMMGAALFSPTLFFGRVPGRAWPFIVASAALELTYFALLSTAYRRAEMSLIFPVARGMAPVGVLLVSVTFLGVAVTTGEVVGVVVLAGGALAVRGLRVPGDWGDVGLALGISGCVAGYTLLDKHGVAIASPLGYFELVLAIMALPYLGLMIRLRGVPALRREVGWRSAAIGVAMVGGYDLVLEGLHLAAAAPVAAIRESSVVVGTVLAAVVLHEKVGAARWAGVGLVTIGVVLLALLSP